MWQEEVQRKLQRGDAMEAMKALMMEMRSFSEKPCVLQLGIDTRSFYTDPAGFGLAMKEAGSTLDDIQRFSAILLFRGRIFLSLQQPARAQRDLRAAQDMGAAGAELQQSLKEARDALEEQEKVERDKEMQQKVPVTVLTGFLGAGKTTLLNYILKTRHGFRYAVIENEVGQIGIDNQLLEPAGGVKRTTENVVLLDNGCLCCTVRSDLVEAVKQILLKADTEAANKSAAHAESGVAAGRVLDGILIETTGLADPGPVCKTFFADPELRARTRVDGVLTLVDTVHFLQQLQRERSEGSVNESAQQVGFADKVLLNKVDAVAPEEVARVEDAIRRMNSICPMHRCSLSKRPHEVPLDELLTVESFNLEKVLEELQADVTRPSKRLKRDETGHGHGDHGHGHETGHGHGHGHDDGHGDHGEGQEFRHDSGIGTCSFVLHKPLVLQRFTQVMNALRAERAVDLYRYKGVVCIKEASGLLRRAVLQGVHDMCEFEPRGDWTGGKPTISQLVFIGRKLDKEKWFKLFEKCQAGILDDPEDA